MKRNNMNTRVILRGLLAVGLLIVAPLFLANCGVAEPSGSEHVPSAHAGPAGPTTPSAYYWDLTIAPHTLYGGGFVSLVTKVTDEYGQPERGVDVFYSLSGGNTIELQGYATTNQNGVAQGLHKIEADTNFLVYVTASVEGTFLTLPVNIVGQSL